MIEMLLLTRSLIPLNSTLKICLYPILLITITLPSKRIRRPRTRPRLLRHLRPKILLCFFIFRLSLTRKFGCSPHDWFFMYDLWNILKFIHRLVKFLDSPFEIGWIIGLRIESWRMRDGFIMPWIKMTVFR